MKIVVFGHDAGHANLQRRITAMQSLGHNVVGLTMRRGPDEYRDWDNHDLGRTIDNNFSQRIIAVMKGIKQSHGHSALKDADIVWARNLDMLGIAAVALKGMNTPLIYETLDIHESLYARGVKAGMLRRLERHFLHRVCSIVVSSPAFVTEYYDAYHPSHPPAYLLENTLNRDEMTPRPARGLRRPNAPICLGWVGILRCERSLRLLAKVAREANGQVIVHLHGKPAGDVESIFRTVIDETPHLYYHGAYSAPDGLAAVYNSLDIVWAGDYTQASGNSRWLLPNRLYEGGYFGVPSIAPEGTQTARWINQNSVGLTITDPAQETLLPRLLSLNENDITSLSMVVRDAETSLFAHGTDRLSKLLNGVLCR